MPESLDVPARSSRRSCRCRRTSTPAGRRRSTARCCPPNGPTAGSRRGCSRPVPPAPSTCGSPRPGCSPACWSSAPLLAGVCIAAVTPLRLRRGPPRELPAAACGPGREGRRRHRRGRGRLPHRLGRAGHPRGDLAGRTQVPGGRRLGVRRGAGAAGRDRRAHVGAPQGAVLVGLLGPGVGDAGARRRQRRAACSCACSWNTRSAWVAGGSRRTIQRTFLNLRIGLSK